MSNINCLSKNRIIQFSLNIGKLIAASLFFHNLALGTPVSLIEIQKSSSDSANSVKAKKIFMKAVEAAGGLETFRNIDNFSIKTRNIITQTQTKSELEVTEIAQLPDKTKLIMKSQMGEITRVLNGNSGWIKVGKKISALTQAEANEMKKGLFRDTINIFKQSDKGIFKVQYFGEETVGGKTNFVLHIQDNSGEFFNLYIDSETFLIAKKAYHGSSEVGLATLEEIYADYRKIKGIMLPFRTIVKGNGKQYIATEVIEVKFNIELDKDFYYKD